MAEVWPELALVGVLILVNAVLAGSEVALISLRQGQLSVLEREGDAGHAAATLARDPTRFLATIQVGITLAGFLASATAAVAIAGVIAPAIDFLGEASEVAAIIVVTLVLSYLTLVFGELVPKRLALQRAMGWARVAGRPLSWMAVVLAPVVWMLSVSTDFVVRVLGGEAGGSHDEITLEELRHLVMANRVIGDDHLGIILGAFELPDQVVGEVMTPRPDVITVDSGASAAEAVRRLADSGHGRAPLVDPDVGLDATIGIVSLSDLVTIRSDAVVDDHVADVMAFPESARVLDVLRSLQRHRRQMALVVDEFGGASGIVTMEDLVEELVGEIHDELDRDVVQVRRAPDGSTLVPGRLPLRDVLALGIEVPDGEYRTVAGLVVDQLGRMGQVGDTVEIGTWSATIEAVHGRSVTLVRFSDARTDSQP
jgi:putative hemolysin